MTTKNCEVCGKRGRVYVRNSELGEFSLAYCADCLASGREPYGLLVRTLMHARSKLDIPAWLLDTVEATLEAEGKTWAQFFEDVRGVGNNAALR